MVSSFLLANRTFAGKNPGVVSSALVGLSEAAGWERAHRDEVAQSLASVTGIPHPVQKVAADWTEFAVRSLSDAILTVQQTTADRLFRLGLINVSDGGRRRYDEVFTRTVYETEHPLVHVHPESGERSLIVGHFIQRILGLTTSDSQHLLAIFHDHATRPENTVRWSWRQGDVAIWDNRATVHWAVDDYDDEPRVVRRVTIQGVAPVSIDGRRSRARETQAGKAA